MYVRMMYVFMYACMYYVASMEQMSFSTNYNNFGMTDIVTYISSVVQCIYTSFPFKHKTH